MCLNWFVPRFFFLLKYGVVSVEHNKDIFGEWISFKFLDGKMLEIYQTNTSCLLTLAVQLIDRHSNVICDFEKTFGKDESANFDVAKAAFKKHRKALKVLGLY